MEGVTALRTKYQHLANEKRKAVEGAISSRTRSIAGHYWDATKIYLKARVC